MSFVKQWLTIIRNCSVDNTYKMAWAKAITEIAMDFDYDSHAADKIEITLEQIAQKVLSYYWDQTIYFDLTQGSNPLKPPVIMLLTKELILNYQTFKGTLQPAKFIRSKVQELCRTEYGVTITNIVSALKKDVSYRFLSLGGQNLEGVYSYSKGASSLYMSLDNLRQLKDYHTTVFEAINYRWAQILENFNQSPRICKKVRIIDEQNIRRKPLKGFGRYLDLENPSHLCFLCGEAIVGEVPAIDHVIPWSFLYSDDLWNLVYAHQSCNSVKSNVIPTEDTIHRLEQRNIRLLHEVQEHGIRDKNVTELEMAIERDMVKKFWIACQG